MIGKSPREWLNRLGTKTHFLQHRKAAQLAGEAVVRAAEIWQVDRSTVHR